ncbi:MAG: leukocidin family pore-forming toxin [Synergistaceae bacterium]|nr:leukocidin family pore-forming toxin [Synergistaceae bacterium]
MESFDVIKMLFISMDLIEQKDDGSVTMKHIQMGESILGDADNPELPYDKEELLKRYESEDIIILLNADINLINSVRSDLGATPEDESILGGHDRLDAYAVARVNTFGLISNFSYIVPKMDDPESDDIVLTSDDVSVIENVDEEEAVSDDQTPELGQPDSSDVLPEELSPYELQVRRWVSFLQWMGNIAAEALRDQATAAIFAAEAAQHDQLTLITSAQTKDWAQTFNYTMGLKSYGGGSYTAVRTNTVKYKIYTAHSFTNGKDYYLVHCEASTNPDTWFDSYVDDGTWKHNFLWGYTKEFGVEQTIDGGGMGTSDVALYDSTPENLNEKKTYSDSKTWNISGTLGVSKDGISAEVGGGFSHTKDLSWEVTEYKIVNDSENRDHLAGAKWYADVNSPETGSKHYVGAPFRYYRDVKATPASTKQLKYESEWIWEVGKNYWKSHPTIKMNVSMWNENGLTKGWTRAGQYYKDRTDQYFRHSKSFSLILDQPSHITVDQTNIIAKREGEDVVIGFLCDYSWKVESDADWCVVNNKSGDDTGRNGKTVTFTVDYNLAFQSTREATITVKQILPDGSTDNTATVKVSQWGSPW